jgi:hypothetical protein
MLFAAWLYALLALVVILFQLALALGAPWGHLAMGGRYPGRFPPRMRIAALVQACLLLLFAVAVLGRAGVVSPPPPPVLVRIVVAVSTLSAVLNLITPSIPERRIWGPVALAMLVCAIRVGLG